MSKRFIEYDGFKQMFSEDCVRMKMDELSEKYCVSWTKISLLKRKYGLVGIRNPKMWGDKISRELNGREFSDDWKKNLSLSRKGKLKGVRFSEDHKKNISDARKGMKFTKEHRKNIGIASSKRIGRVCSAEVRDRLSLSAAKKHMAGNDRRKNGGFVYNGRIFMNVWEAKVAARLDDLGLKWEYERYVYLLKSGKRYIPDFKVGDLFIEVRHNSTSDRWKKMTEFSEDHDVVVVTDVDGFEWVKLLEMKF